MEVTKQDLAVMAEVFRQIALNNVSNNQEMSDSYKKYILNKIEEKLKLTNPLFERFVTHLTTDIEEMFEDEDFRELIPHLSPFPFSHDSDEG